MLNKYIQELDLQSYDVFHECDPYKPMFFDVMRTITIQIIAQLLFSINNPSITFLDNVFIETSIYLCIGVVMFWLIIYKIIISYNVFQLNI